MIGTLYIAASKGIAYGTRAGRTWVSVREDPALFWISVIFQVACLAFGLGVPLGVACTLRKLKAARAQTTSVAALSNVMSGADRDLGETWEERLWRKNRRRLWWMLPLLAVFIVWVAGATYINVSSGGFPSRGRWISIHDDPEMFWWPTALLMFAVAVCVGLPPWVVYRIRTLKARRARADRNE
jgi:hypothetical protein